MDFVSTRIITADIDRLVGFYEKATGVPAAWATEDFAELRTPHGTLAIGSTRTVPLFAPGSARPAENRSVIIEFRVADVDALHRELSGSAPDPDPDPDPDSDSASASGFVPEFVAGPTTMPWGNRSLLLRDPDGNLVNFFTPPAGRGGGRR